MGYTPQAGELWGLSFQTINHPAMNSWKGWGSGQGSEEYELCFEEWWAFNREGWVGAKDSQVHRQSSRSHLEKRWSLDWKRNNFGLSTSARGHTNSPEKQHFPNCMPSDFMKYLKKGFVIKHLWVCVVIKAVYSLQDFAKTVLL